MCVGSSTTFYRSADIVKWSVAGQRVKNSSFLIRFHRKRYNRLNYYTFDGVLMNQREVPEEKRSPYCLAHITPLNWLRSFVVGKEIHTVQTGLKMRLFSSALLVFVLFGCNVSDFFYFIFHFSFSKLQKFPLDFGLWKWAISAPLCTGGRLIRWST